MFEPATDRRLRSAYHAAHEARAEAIRAFWKRLARNSRAG